MKADWKIEITLDASELVALTGLVREHVEEIEFDGPGSRVKRRMLTMLSDAVAECDTGDE